MANNHKFIPEEGVLTSWSDKSRAMPSILLRSALFAAIQRNERRNINRAQLPSSGDCRIFYAGPQLDQADLDVWGHILHLARGKALTTPVCFSAHAFLRAIGRATGGKQHEWLKEAFARLGGCFLEVTHRGNITEADGLIRFKRNEVTNHIELFINPAARQLFDIGYTQIKHEQRKSLVGKPLALWLHGFLAAHISHDGISIEILHRLSGSRNSELRGFKRDLKKALDNLKEVGAILSWSINEKNMLFVSKPRKKAVSRPKLTTQRENPARSREEIFNDGFDEKWIERE